MHVRSTMSSPPRGWTRGRIASLGGALGALLALAGCDSARVIVPMPADTHAAWTRLTGSALQDPFYPDWRGDSILLSVAVSGRFRNALIRSDGSRDTTYSGGGLWSDLSPRWVARDLAVFASNRAGNFDLWYLRPSDGSTRPLTSFTGNEVSPAPRPGSPGIAYTEAGGTTLNGRIVLLPDTAQAALERHYLTPDTLKAGEPDWAPTGNRICFSAQGPDSTRQIWLITIGASDTTLTRLTTGPFHDLTPRFSPDGTRIVFTSDRTGRPGVWVVSPAGQDQVPTLVSFDDAGRTDSTPAWSPDGHRIIVSSGGPGRPVALYILSDIGY